MLFTFKKSMQLMLNFIASHTSQSLPGWGNTSILGLFLSKAYDTVPRLQLWDHLQHIAMPALLLLAIKGMYQDDEYILMDGDKGMCASNRWS
eukprot:980027-Pelagomonas_calceolata.AAC.1